MRTVNEYERCSCGYWARIERGEPGYRDRVVCAKCGRIQVRDDIPPGVHVELKEAQDDDND